MLKQTYNNVRIEGIVSEIDLQDTTFKKNNVDTPCIKGTVKVRVNGKISNKDVELEIPVQVFAGKFTNAGSPNPAYESAKKVMDEFVSIAASDEASATRVRITNANIQMNEYYNQNGKLISFPRVSASFFTKIKKEDCKPDASFNITLMVGSRKEELNKDEEPTGRWIVNGAIVQYGGKVDVVPFYVESERAIEGIQSWDEGDTVSVKGKLNFSSRIETVVRHMDFGDDDEFERTVSVSELIITGGSAPLSEDDENKLDPTEILKGTKERTARLEESKKQAAAGGSSTKKAPAGKSKEASDLGF